ncbi:hypothetical protein HanIR_Chr13g0632291 [Helianthus annuus]|nr:hypothetical protein HanIR_Chr13g0632291 [Helianthus annuus]
MKVHPDPHKRNITVWYDFASQSTAAGSICRQKKLRRLPHNFGNDLELLFYSDATSWFTKRLNRLDGGGWVEGLWMILVMKMKFRLPLTRPY